MSKLPSKFFLESPLYAKFEFDIPEKKGDLWVESFNMICPECKRPNTFKCELYPDYTRMEQEKGTSLPNTKQTFTFRCQGDSCYAGVITYYVRILPAHERGIIKIGQEPSLLTLHNEPAFLAAADLELYKKGLTCESHGFGIGAYAYYRRLLETRIDKIATSVLESLTQEHQKALQEKLNKTQPMKDQIDLLKDFVPDFLIANGQNPLKIIYSVLSGGLHQKTDAACLIIAAELRESLLYLLEVILRNEKQKAEFSKKISDLKNKSNKLIAQAKT